MSEEYDDVRTIAVEIALEEVKKHVKEEGTENYGPEIAKYKKAAHSAKDKEQGWCGMFVYWCYLQAANRVGKTLPFIPEQLWRGNKLHKWTLSHPESVVYTCPILPGDIYVLSKNNMNHIGMVVELMTDASVMQTIDGNQSTADSGKDSLRRRTRHFAETAFIVRI